MLRVRVRALLSAMSLLAGGAACFSSRGPTDNTGLQGECRFSLGGGVPGTTVVAVRSFTFTPVEAVIRSGGTVTWVNCDPAGSEFHTSTADAGEWSSPTLAPDDVFSHTFSQPGRYTYHCTPHPSMTAAVVVE